jgi:conserved oligomeric Golgi complex subunit 3
VNAPAPTPLLTEQDWASQAAAEELHAKFVESCERDLRAAVMKLRLYLEDDRTVSVLLTHVKEAVVDGYMGYREVVQNMYAGALKGAVYSEESLKERLHIICDELE